MIWRPCWDPGNLRQVRASCPQALKLWESWVTFLSGGERDSARYKPSHRSSCRWVNPFAQSVDHWTVVSEVLGLILCWGKTCLCYTNTMQPPSHWATFSLRPSTSWKILENAVRTCRSSQERSRNRSGHCMVFMVLKDVDKLWTCPKKKKMRSEDVVKLGRSRNQVRTLRKRHWRSNDVRRTYKELCVRGRSVAHM
jgi:hypothetical protein